VVLYIHFILIIQKIDLNRTQYSIVIYKKMSSSTESAQAMIINATVFNPAKDVKYTKPKVNPSGGKSIGICNSHTNKSLYLSTPLMLTWGAQQFVDEKTGKVSYSMSLQFPGDDYKTDATDKMLKAIVDFEKKIKEDAIKNSKEWLNKTKMSEEVVDALFHPMLKYPKDKNSGEPDLTRSPTLNVKIGCWENKFNCEIYDTEQNLLFPNEDTPELGPVELIPKQTNAAVVLQCGGLWFANGKFGCTWKLFQAVVKPRSSMKGKCMISLSVDDKTLLDKRSSEPEEDEDHDIPPTVTSTATLTVAEDSDDESQPEPVKPKPVVAPVVEPVVVPEPVKVAEPQPVVAAEPVKKVVKKVVKKKTGDE
jgi:hypothetical protein